MRTTSPNPRHLCAALLCLMTAGAPVGAAAETHLEDPLRPLLLRQHALRRCYDVQRARLPTARGVLELTFTVKPGGRISQILVTRDTVIPEQAAAQRAEFEACVTGVLARVLLNYYGEEDITMAQRLQFEP